MLYVCIYVAPWTREARHFVPLYVPTCCTVNLNLNLNCISIQTLNSALSWSTFTASRLFCLMRQDLHISIWQLSAILLLISSPLKLCQVGLGQTHIFRFLQKYLIRLKPRLWLGHSKTFTELSISHSCSVLRDIYLLEGEPSAQFEVLNALDWVFIKAVSILWCIELFFYSDESLSPCHWKTAWGCSQHTSAKFVLL